MSIFEQASRQKLRFRAKNGLVTAEDLWDLKLKDLDEIAVGVQEQVTKTAANSFLKPKSGPDKTLTLTLEVLVHIITTKQEEARLATEAAEKRQKRNQLLELIDQKKNDELKGKSVDELMKELAALSE
jgi:hypothetical protein